MTAYPPVTGGGGVAAHFYFPKNMISIATGGGILPVAAATCSRAATACRGSAWARF